jgi:hypothetical protein
MGGTRKDDVLRFFQKDVTNSEQVNLGQNPSRGAGSALMQSSTTLLP